MEDNKKEELLEQSTIEEDFSDFDDEEENILPEIDEDLAAQDALEEETPEIDSEETNNEAIEPESSESIAPKETVQEISPWEELDENNSVVKKYIFYVSKDFVPYIDKLTTDERSAYINDAIQRKMDAEDEQKQKNLKTKLMTHFILMILIIILMTPVALFVGHKAIMATLDNYKYSQENFEKLFKSRFENDRAYIRSIQYNKELESRKKKQ